MILEHYSKSPLLTVHDASQPEGPTHKPIGLWVSLPGDDDWPNWCRDEDYRVDHLAYVTRFRLMPGSHVLHLKSCLDIDLFHAEYYVGGPRRWDGGIDWGRVAARYDGIIIAPYQWGRRLDGDAHSWYYGWDCASGCIWDSRALEMTAAWVSVS
jgi:hypothetical protein